VVRGSCFSPHGADCEHSADAVENRVNSHISQHRRDVGAPQFCESTWCRRLLGPRLSYDDLGQNVFRTRTRRRLWFSLYFSGRSRDRNRNFSLFGLRRNACGWHRSAFSFCFVLLRRPETDRFSQFCETDL